MSEQNRTYEIEWRELLIKRLKTTRTALRRDAAAEKKQRDEAKQLATGYSSFDEAHEAYGWGYITEKQLDAIKAVYENEESQTAAALRRMTLIIGTLQGEISNLRGDDVQEAAIQRHAEGLEQSGLAPAT